VTDLSFFAAVMASVFAIVDPFGALPFFVALTDGFQPSDREAVLRRAVLVVGTLLTVFAIFGRFLFEAFGFSLAAFEIAGGALLFLVAYEMLMGEIGRTKLTEADRAEALARRDEVSIVPLGIPLLAGPGALSTVMIYTANAGDDLWNLASIFVAIGVTAVATLFILRYGQGIFRSLGRVGVMALTRVMGLILAAVAVQFILNGILAAFPQI